MKLVIRKGINNYKSILLILFMCYEQIIGIMNFVINLDAWGFFAQIFIIILLLILFFKASQKEKIICLGFALSLSFAILLFPHTPAVMSENGLQKSLQITQGFIGFFVAYLCSDNNKLLRDLKVVGIILFTYNVWFVMTGRVYATANYNAAGYNMAFGFAAMTACLISVYFAYAEKNKVMKMVWAVMSIVLSAFIMVLGSRGALIGVVCILVISYLTVYLRDSQSISNKKVMTTLALFILVIFFLIVPEVFFSALSSVLSTLGINAGQSRTLEHIINGTLTVSSGRSIVWDWFSSNLNLLGHGAFSEWYYYGGYAHNFFLDVLFDFGVIFGGIMVVVFVGMIIKSFRKGQNFESYSLFLITFAYFIGRLLLSSTFWWETYFWMLIGVMARILYQNSGFKCNGYPIVGRRSL